MPGADLRERLIAPCAIVDPDSGQFRAGDPSALLTYSLLFEHYVIDSVHLREIPYLVRLIGAEATTELLLHGDITIKCEARTLGETSESTNYPGGSRPAPLPRGTYHFIIGWDVPPDQWLEDGIRGVSEDLESGVTKPELERLSAAIETRFFPLPDDFGRSSLTEFELELASDRQDLYDAALAHVVSRHPRTTHVDGSQVHLEVAAGTDHTFATATNLARFGIDAQLRHELVQNALFAVGGLSVRIQEMRALSAISGMQPEELPLFSGRMAFLGAELRPERQVARFDRVVSIAGLPDIGAALAAGAHLDIDRFLAAKQSRECRELRAWLRTLSDEDQAEMGKQIDLSAAFLPRLATSRVGLALRFAVVTAAGAIPGVGLPLSAGLGAADTFLVDRLAGSPGPAVFLDKYYAPLVA